MRVASVASELEGDFREWLSARRLLRHLEPAFKALGIETLEDLQFMIEEGDVTKGSLCAMGVKPAPAAKVIKATQQQ